MLEENAKFIFAIGFQTVFSVTYFCDWLIQTVFFCNLGSNLEKQVPQQSMIAKVSAFKVVSTLCLTCQYALVKPSRLKATNNVDLDLDGVRLKIS